MKTITHILTLPILLMFALPILAGENEPPIEKPMASPMENMRSQMQTMHEQMKELKAAKDPERRKALMQQHMQSMREGMIMMGKTDDIQGEMMGRMNGVQNQMGQKAMQEKMNEQIACQQKDAACQRAQIMEHRQEGMPERMKMLQMMMQQMMEHQSEQTVQQ